MDFIVNQIINNRYQLLRSIGFGSFGEVWLAKDNVLDMNIAIKIYVALDSRGFNEFKHEFRTAYSLHHPNLLRADYFDSIEKNPYLVMPYCSESVGDKIGQMGEKDLWKFIYDVSGGLEYLHDNDVIHRDIKPDNILRNENGVYVITDFGLSTKMRSTLRKASKRQNDSNQSGGTIGYMAPEMFAASPQAVKATDIWAFGATLFELATGEMPFCGQGGVMETYGAEMPDIPHLRFTPLLNLIHQCLAKEPWDRPTARTIHEQAAQQLGMTNPTNNGGTGNEQKYVKQIEKLKDEITTLKAGNNKTTGKKRYKPLFFITLLGFCGSIVYNNIQQQKYEEIIDITNSQLHSANELINNIEEIIETPPLANEELFSDWTSSNHEHNSTGTRVYEFEASFGDKISFDYDVDSEGCDHFYCNLIHNGNETKIKDASGRDQRGFVRYLIPDDGNYKLKFSYRKDYSVNTGRDNACVSNIKQEQCVETTIKRLLNDYKQSEDQLYEDSIECIEDSIAWEEDTCVYEDIEQAL